MGHDVSFCDEVVGNHAVQRERNGSLSTQVGCVSVAAAPRSESQVRSERKRQVTATNRSFLQGISPWHVTTQDCLGVLHVRPNVLS